MTPPNTFTYDLSAPILDYANKAMTLGAGPTGRDIPATFAHFCLMGLGNAYEGETLSIEAKAYRINLSNQIRNNMTAVNLTFVDRMLLCDLVNRVSQAPIIFQRVLELFEKTDIPALVPVYIPPAPSQEVVIHVPVEDESDNAVSLATDASRAPVSN